MNYCIVDESQVGIFSVWVYRRKFERNVFWLTGSESMLKACVEWYLSSGWLLQSEFILGLLKHVCGINCQECNWMVWIWHKISQSSWIEQPVATEEIVFDETQGYLDRWLKRLLKLRMLKIGWIFQKAYSFSKL
jgi:hypothetical protein